MTLQNVRLKRCDFMWTYKSLTVQLFKSSVCMETERYVFCVGFMWSTCKRQLLYQTLVNPIHDIIYVRINECHVTTGFLLLACKFIFLLMTNYLCLVSFPLQKDYHNIRTYYSTGTGNGIILVHDIYKLSMCWLGN